MHKVKHTANSRGLADHGWLKSNHSFSFANYYNSDRINFGALRVLNDDIFNLKWVLELILIRIWRLYLFL